jgi:hypothetical protein
VDLNTLIQSAPTAILALVGLYLFFTGKIHSDSEFAKLERENEELKAALGAERQANNELARAGGVTNQLIGALVDVASSARAAGTSPARRRPARRGGGPDAEDLGLLCDGCAGTSAARRSTAACKTPRPKPSIRGAAWRTCASGSSPR